MAVVVQKLNYVINIIEDTKPVGEQVLYIIPTSALAKPVHREPNPDTVQFLTDNGEPTASVTLDGTVKVQDLGGSPVLWVGTIDEFVDKMNEEYLNNSVTTAGAVLPTGAATEATLIAFYNAFLDSQIVRHLSPPINSDKVDANVVGTTYLLKAIRITNATLVLKKLVLSAMVTTNDNVDIILLKNPTYTVDPVWNDILDYTGAATGAQYSNPDLVGNPSNTTLTGGELLYTVALSGAVNILESSEITINLDNITDTYALAVIPSNSGNNADVFGNINILL